MSATKILFVLGCASLPALAAAQSASPWLPIPQSGTVGINYVSQSGTDAYVGDKLPPISDITSGAASNYKRQNLGLNFAYGFSDAFSLDVALGRAKVKVGGADNDSGWADSKLAFNWRVIDEYERRSAPTLTLRAALIINGGYDGAKLAAIGKAASGIEVSALIGRQITNSFKVWGGIGFEKRSDIPSARFVDLNAAYSALPGLSLSVGYTNKQYSGNLEIGGPGFSPAKFQQVKEERSTARVGVAYAVASNQSIALSFGKALKGRNTVKDDRIIGLSYSVGF
jgi:hypothetical protein